MKNEEIIRAVVYMLGADGDYDPREMRFLNNLCRQLELPRKCVIDAFRGINSGKTRIKIPADAESKSRIMGHLIDAAMSDGKIEDREQKALQRMAEKMGIAASEIAQRIGNCVQRDAEPAYDIDALTADDLLGGGPKAGSQVLARCPKCGYEAIDPDDALIKGPHGAGECPFCGVIVDKYRGSGV